MSRQVVSFSGGKDSTAMLLMMLERGERVDQVLFFDGGWEFPEMYEHVDRVERDTGVEITRVRPDHPFDYYMFDYVKKKGRHKGERGYGWPQPFNRWCTTKKNGAIDRMVGKDDIQCVGLAKGEERRVRDKRYPLIEWGVTEDEALEYCRSRGYDWGGLYDRYTRLSCWCCPLQNMGNLQALYDLRPDLWEKLKEMDSRSFTDFRHRMPLDEMERRLREGMYR